MDDKNTHFAEVLARLRDGHESFSWPRRREVTAELAPELAGGNVSEEAYQLVHLLAEDVKWEVRKDIADLLLSLPEKDFAPLAARLSDDTNAFVRKAAERAIDRRRKGQQQAGQTHAGLDRLRSRWETLERVYGKRAASQARRVADQEFEHLVGTTVHEMRNVLTPLKASVASISKQLDGTAPEPTNLRRQAQKALGRIAFLERLLDDMRSFSQPLPQNRRREPLHAVVQEAVGMAQDALAASGRNPRRVAVGVDIPVQMTVEITRHHVLVAIANVVKNAIEAYATGPVGFRTGTVSIVARGIGRDHVEIVVRDEGMGIAADDLEEVRQFTPGKTTKRNLGTGFGLPIARRNVLAHGGELAIMSRQGEGTTVTITLPLEPHKGGQPWRVERWL